MTKDEVFIGELAKGLTAFCVRNNTSIEELHSSKEALTDEKMKALMIEIVNNVYFVLKGLYSDGRSVMEGFLRMQERMYAKEWNAAEDPAWIGELKDWLCIGGKSEIERGYTNGKKEDTEED